MSELEGRCMNESGGGKLHKWIREKNQKTELDGMSK